MPLCVGAATTAAAIAVFQLNARIDKKEISNERSVGRFYTSILSYFLCLSVCASE